MSRTVVWLMLVVGGILYHALWGHDWSAFFDGAYFSGAALLVHWLTKAR